MTASGPFSSGIAVTSGKYFPTKDMHKPHWRLTQYLL